MSNDDKEMKELLFIRRIAIASAVISLLSLLGSIVELAHVLA